MHTTDSDEAWYGEEAGPLVRPYLMTAGRTGPERGQLDVIALFVSRAVPTSTPLLPEQAQIVELCRRPLSVAELGAQLDLPLGTVRLLLGHLLEAGLIETHVPPALSESPSPELLQAILAGLRAL